MPIIATQTKEYDPIPEGTHIARIYQIIHVGTVPTQYMGEAKETNKVRITFELPKVTQVFKEGDGPKPRIISQDYTISTSQKANLRRLIEAVIGTALLDEEPNAFNVETLAGQSCLVTIQHKLKKDGSGKFAGISSIATMIDGVEVPAQVNPTKILNYEESWDQEFYDQLPKFLKDQMATSLEYKKLKGITGEIIDGEIPF